MMFLNFEAGQSWFSWRTREYLAWDAAERAQGDHAEAYALHEDLLTLRREHAPFRSNEVDGATLATDALVLRFSDLDGETRLLVINLGADLHLDPPAEPLLAPISADRGWSLLWSSEDPRDGGGGIPPFTRDSTEVWHLPARSATVLSPVGT